MTMSRELEVLRDVNLLSVQPPKAIWQDGTVVIEGLHRAEFDRVLQRARQLKNGGARQNIILEGRPGVGKSHVLGRVRREAMAADDLFVALQLTKANEFWPALSLGYAEAFFKPHAGKTQLRHLLDALLKQLGFSFDKKLAFVLDVDETSLPGLHQNVEQALGLGPEARTAADIAVALVLFNSPNHEHHDIAYALFEGLEIDDDQRRRVGLKSKMLHPREVVRGVDRLVALCGKVTITALDQLDGLITVALKGVADGDRSELNIIANDLMDFAEIADNTLVIVSCVSASWKLICDEAIQSAQYRFPDIVKLGDVPSAECGRELIGEVLRREYERLGFVPPHSTWPVRPEAFADAPDYTPRTLILAVDSHIRRCAQQGVVAEMDRLSAGRPEPSTLPPLPPSPPPPDGVFSDLDRKFAELTAAARVPDFRAEAVEQAFPPLLYSALVAFVGENADPVQLALDEIPGAKQAVNARLRQVLDAGSEDEVHWSFRLIPHAHGRSQLVRLQAAITGSGLGLQRYLIVIRNALWSPGAKTQEVVAALSERGGIVAALTEADFRTFYALHALVSEMPAGFQAWLRERRPASSTALFARIALYGDGAGAGAEGTAGAGAGDDGRTPSVKTSADTPAKEAASIPDVPAGHILLGRAPDTNQAITLRLGELRRHAVVFAGSGSGKTVLLRRIIEECALHGVPSIVLDPNNDLARLGTANPTPHHGWLPGDIEKAARYQREVEVVVWTPRMSSGRPLSFAPLAGLAGLAAIAGEPDDFEVALDCAVDLLAPRARLSLATAKGQQGRAVLKQAARAYVRKGHETLHGFLGFLAGLPEGVSELENAGKLAADMAETLKAESINDPMFGDHGQAIDPEVLFTPATGKRVRVSVISFIGLPNLEQQQQFVRQLQLAVFSWVKKHPAGDRPLRGLFVMDEAQNFAPSVGATPSTGATMALASQARKYGLGLLFATQAPKGLHNNIPGNCATQLFGFLSVSAQIAAANELAAARGGKVTGVARLRPGEFYLARNGLAFQRIDTPFCLTHHPKSPLAQEEVLALAAMDREPAMQG